MRISAIIAIFVITLVTGMFPESLGFCKRKTGDDVISLRVQNEPLGDVLQTISEMTGHLFILERKWENLPVSASFQNLSLHRGMQRILKDLNNAIIYGSDGEITIFIKDKSSLRTMADNDSAAQTAQGEEASAVDSSLLTESSAPVHEPLNQPTEGQIQESPEQFPESLGKKSKPEFSLPPEEIQSSANDSGAGVKQDSPEPSVVPAVPDTETAIDGSQPKIGQRQEP